MQNQTLEEAIAAYTRGAACAEFQETQKGQFRKGMLADLVLLTDNIFAAPEEDIMDVCGHDRMRRQNCLPEINYDRDVISYPKLYLNWRFYEHLARECK